jgi:hypothetical protein
MPLDTTNSNTFEELQTAISAASNWNCEIKCHGYHISKPTMLLEYDICDLFVPCSQSNSYTSGANSCCIPLSHLKLWEDSIFRFDPVTFLGIDHRHAIKEYIKNACRCSGFLVETEVKLRKPSKKQLNPSKSCTIRFKCAHNKKALSELSKDEEHGKLLPIFVL